MTDLLDEPEGIRVEVTGILRAEPGETILLFEGTVLDASQERVVFAADHRPGWALAEVVRDPGDMPPVAVIEPYQIVRRLPVDTPKERMLLLGLAPDEAEDIARQMVAQPWSDEPREGITEPGE